MSDGPKSHDLDLLREAIAESQRAVEAGNHPFGALLASGDGEVLLRSQNRVTTERDVTAHAETELVRAASRRFDRATLETCTLYSSAEPCPMCAGAIHWSGIRRVVYGLSQERLYQLTGSDERNETFELPCRAVLSYGRAGVEVVGPLLEDEAEVPHREFWRGD